MNVNQDETNDWGKPGTAKAWCRQHITFVRVPMGEHEIRCFCAQARAATDADARARMIVQFLGLGHLADPALDGQVDDALAALVGQAPALARLPVLNANNPQGIVRWCDFVMSQPADQAIALSRPLHPVMGRLTDEAALAVGQVLRWAMFKERPQPR